MKKKIIIIFIIVIAVAIFIFRNDIFGAGSSKRNTLPTVSVIELQPTKVSAKQELSGRTAAFQFAKIRPQVTGIITERLFKEGSYVKEGQQLYQIDPLSYKASYNSSLAKLYEALSNQKTALAKKKRFDKYSKQGTIISKIKHEEATFKYDQSVSHVKVAEAEVEKSKILLDYTKVYAPISGYIGKSKVTKGALVTANQSKELATITELNPIFVDVHLSSSEFSKLKKNIGDLQDTPVQLVYNNNTHFVQGGKLLFHEVNVDQSTSSVQLRALFPNDDQLLFPGMFVRLIIKEQYDNVFLIPHNVTWRDEDGSLLVWSIDEQNIAKPIKINSERIFGSSWLIKSGIKPGAKIVSDNFMHLKPGTKVRVKEEKE